MVYKIIKEFVDEKLLKDTRWNNQNFMIIFFVGIMLFNLGTFETNAEVYTNLDLKSNIIPLKTTRAENGFEDLKQLKGILKDKKIVAMGEATHGTKEFFQIKHRIFEFLVEEMGHKAFAIEAEFGGAQEVNNYILNGIGNAYDAVGALQFSIWQTEEVLQMVKWMKDYNENPGNTKKIRFYGFDMQSASRDIDKVLAYLEKVDKEIESEYKYDLTLIKRSAKNISIDTIENLRKIFEENKEDYINKTSNIEYEMVYQHLEIIDQWIQLKEVKGVDYANKRDKYMAENVEWILDYEKNFDNDKIMLWAHNGHVSKKFINYKSMGEHLSEIYGEMLYVIGFDFYKGSFMANPANIIGNLISNRMALFTIEKGDSRVFAAVFEETGIPLGFMDFKLASRDPEIYDWLLQTHYTRSIGGVYFGKYIELFAPEIPIESYDGLIFIRETTASVRMNKDEKIISDGDRYLTIYYLTRLIIIICILFFIVRFIKKRKIK